MNSVGGILITLPSKGNKDQFQWYGLKYQLWEMVILYITRYFMQCTRRKEVTENMKIYKDYEIQSRKIDCQGDRTHSTLRFTFWHILLCINMDITTNLFCINMCLITFWCRRELYLLIPYLIRLLYKQMEAYTLESLEE